MDDPVGVLLLTYDRFEYAKQTLHSALSNLRYSGPLVVHIADDGSPPGYIAALEEIVASHGLPVSSTNADRAGYGGSFNLGTQVLHSLCEYVLPLEDDWVLDQPLDLDPLVEALEESLNCIRLGYIGFTQELRGKLEHIANRTYLVFDPDSAERHVNAGHPRLEKVSFQRTVGPWAERIGAGATEHDWCGRSEARQRVAWPMDLCRVFGHIGSVQARDD